MFGMAENGWGGCVLVMFMYVVEYVPVLGVTDVGLSGLYSSSNKIHKLVCDMSLISHTFFFHPPPSTHLTQQTTPHYTLMQQHHLQQTEDFWKEKFILALKEIEELKERIFELEKEIEKERGKTYLERLRTLLDEEKEISLKKVWVMWCVWS
jgi:hypothetical protein